MKQSTPVTVRIPERVWHDLQDHFPTSSVLRDERYAVLLGSRAHRRVIVTITGDDPHRLLKRAVARDLDLDVVGQAHQTFEDLDLAVERTKDEQERRGQDIYSLPDGHVFLHCHVIAGRPVWCAFVVHDRVFVPATITITRPRAQSGPRTDEDAPR